MDHLFLIILEYIDLFFAFYKNRFFDVDERIGQVLQSFKGLESLMNLNSSLARDLGLNLISVLFVSVSDI